VLRDEHRPVDSELARDRRIWVEVAVGLQQRFEERLACLAARLLVLAHDHGSTLVRRRPD